jgi:hypothetical protein
LTKKFFVVKYAFPRSWNAHRVEAEDSAEAVLATLLDFPGAKIVSVEEAESSSFSTTKLERIDDD